MKNDVNPNPWFDFFFLKSVFSKLVLLLIIGVGVLAYKELPKETLPNLEIPQALIISIWAGASPQMIEQEVTNPIEFQLKSVSTIKRVRSGSLDSMSIISVEFDANASMKESMRLLRDKVSIASAEFPKRVKAPYIEAFSVTDIPVATIVLNGNVEDEQLSTLSRKIQKRFEKLNGCKKVEVSGVGEKVVEVVLNPERLMSLGIPPTLVMEKINDANVNMSFGNYENNALKSTINLNGKFKSGKELKQLLVAKFQNRNVYLNEISNVRFTQSKSKVKTSFSMNGSSFSNCSTINVYKTPGGETKKVIDNLKAELSVMQNESSWVEGVGATTVYDESEIIEDRLGDMFDNAWQTMIIVFVVLFLLLTWREALVAGLSIPLTFLGTMAVLYLMNQTLNELVIIGLVLSLGLLVDDFILVMEGMHEGIFQKAYSFKEAAHFTVKSYALPSLSGSLTTILVLVPLLFIGGIDGKFIKIIPITMAICLSFSFLISLFLNIPLSYYVFKSKNRALSQTFVDKVSNKVSSKLQSWLHNNTLRSKRVAAIWFGGTLVVFLMSSVIFSELPSTMYPDSDSRNLGITIELPQGESLDASAKVAQKIGSILKQKRYLRSTTQYVGRRSPFSEESISDWLLPSNSPNYIGFSCQFSKREERNEDAYQYLPSLRKEIENELFAEYPTAKLILSGQKQGASSEDPIQIEITGPDTTVLQDLVSEVKQILATIDGISDIRDLSGIPKTDMTMEPKRQMLQLYGISQTEFALQTRLLWSFDEIGKLQNQKGDKEIPILLGTGWPSRESQLGGPTKLSELQTSKVISNSGNQIPVLSLVDIQIQKLPQSITHKDGNRVATVMAQSSGRPMSSIQTDIEKQLTQISKIWPPDYKFDIGGQAESMEATKDSSIKIFSVAMAVVFSILALLFGSFKQPFIIIFSVPFALIGTFLGFFFIGMPVSFPAAIGIITLIGIVVNDSIVLIEKMNDYYRSGLSLAKAASQGAADRFRPIISTTLTTTIGLIPLALSSKEWEPLCLAIIFGLTAATFISLALIPALYYLFQKESAASKKIVSL